MVALFPYLVFEICIDYVYQIIQLCNLREDVKKAAHTIIDKFAERGLRSLGVARQVSFIVFFPDLKNFFDQ